MEHLLTFVPVFLKPFFWDVDLAALEVEKHQVFIIERLMEMGDKQAVVWLRNTYEPKLIARVVCHSKKISYRTANLWRLRLRIQQPILCLTPLFQSRRVAWSKP